MQPIKRAIALCWIMLVACFAIKLFGGNWFEIVCTNEHFSNICRFVENNRIVYEALSLFVYTIPSVFMVLSISLLPKPTKKQLYIVIVGVVIVWYSKFISYNFKSALEMINSIVMPVVLKFDKNNFKLVLKKNWWLGIVGSFIVFSFQFLSLITKNIGLKLLNDNLVITYILLIDYYIMVSIYFLYIKLKFGGKENG